MKNSSHNKKLSVTVGIPTCYGGESLIATVKSILSGRGAIDLEIIIQADRTPLTDKVKKTLKDLGVQVYWNQKEGSQFKKLNQIIAKATKNIFIFTQDDIIFDKDALSEIEKTFHTNPTLTMLSTRVLPLAPLNFFEASMATMLRIVDKTGQAWNKGDNHLMASGRCMAFRTDFLRKYKMPETIITGDAYLYLENRRLGGKFTYTPKGIVYIRCPQNMKDQMGPSSRYQYSKEELTTYFGDVTKEYQIPNLTLLQNAFTEFLAHPLSFSYYVGIFIYSRLKKHNKKIVKNPVWNVDVSTKKLQKA